MALLFVPILVGPIAGFRTLLLSPLSFPYIWAFCTLDLCILLSAQASPIQS